MATTYTQTLTDGNDTFMDVPGRNTEIIGLGGNDILYGEDGDDDIRGDGGLTLFGNDTIYGGPGNDGLGGGDGSDVVYGGPGDDRIGFNAIMSNTLDIDKAYGGEGNDTFGVHEYDGEAFLYGGVGDDTYSYQGGFGATHIIEQEGEGIDTIQYFLYGVSGLTLPDNVENVYIGADGRAEIIGNALDNVMSGGLEEFIFYGLGGNDTLTGFRRADQLYGGSGNDTLEGGSDEDILDGGTGDDILKGASNVYVTSSGLDIDKLIGGEGDDTYYADTSDTIVENKHEGLDTLFAVPRSDLSTDFYVPDNVEKMTILDPDYTVTGTVYFDGYGNDQRNTIEGNSHDNALFGYGGNDLLIGGDGNDELDGGKGRDRYDGGAGNDQFIYDPADFRGKGGKGENAGTEGTVGLSSTESSSLRGKGAESQYSGGTGTDSLVLPIAFPHLDLTKLADNKIRGIDVIEAEPVKGGAASLTLTASDVIAISDNGTLRIEDGFGAGILSVYSKNQGWTLSGTEVIDDVTYEVYKVGQATLVVDADLGGVIS